MKKKISEQDERHLIQPGMGGGERGKGVSLEEQMQINEWSQEVEVRTMIQKKVPFQALKAT